MRPAEHLKIGAVAALLAALGSAHAAPPAAASGGAPTAITIAPQGVTPAAEMPARKASEIAIGRETPRAESLKELEELQRQAYFLELRNKIRELNGAVGTDSRGAPAPAPAGSPSVQSGMRPSPAQLGSFVPAAPQPYPPVAPTVYGDQPSARLLSVIQMNARTRADVLIHGSVVTVKEGDDLGEGWHVASIKPGAVRAEKLVTLTRPDPKYARSAPARAGRSRKTGAAPAAAAHVPMVSYEKTMVAMLRPAEKPAAPVEGAPAVATGNGGGVPPLPSGFRRPVDSTAVPPAVPLGAGPMVGAATR